MARRLDPDRAWSVRGIFCRKDKPHPPQFSYHRRLQFEPLEDRRALAVFTVTNLDDLFVDSAGDAPGTLRQALFDANATPGVDTIDFQAGLSGAILLNQGELRVTDSVSIVGPGAGALTINAQSSTRVMLVDDGNGANLLEVSVNGLTLSGGDATIGGGILMRERLTITDSVVSGNAADSGGGIYLTPMAELVLLRTSVSGNTATAAGGGIYNYGGSATITESTISGNSAVDAGGISNGAGGSLTLVSSTVSGNMTTGGMDAFNVGGGIFNNGGTATIRSSTLSGNQARYGGGLYVLTSPATTTIVSNSTISDNTALVAGGGIYNFVGRIVIEFSTITDNQAPTDFGSGVASFGDLGTSLVEVYSSIIAANVDSDVDIVGGDTNTFRSNDYNLVGTGDAAASFNQSHDHFVSSIELLLGPLANNGGPTRTHLLLGGSRAINAGEPLLAPGSGGVPDFDQRGAGFGRVVGTRIDVGAFELQVSLPDLIGDYNGDLTVNAADYTVWRNTLGAFVDEYDGADGNGNGEIDRPDFDVWKSRYGDTLQGMGAGADTANNIVGLATDGSLIYPPISPSTGAMVDVAERNLVLSSSASDSGLERVPSLAIILDQSQGSAGRLPLPSRNATQRVDHSSSRDQESLAWPVVSISPHADRRQNFFVVPPKGDLVTDSRSAGLAVLDECFKSLKFGRDP